MADPARRALVAHGAAIASPVTVFAFERDQVAEHLGLVGAMVGETAIVAAVAVIVASLTPRLRNALPATMVLLLGAIVAAIGIYLMAWTIELNLFVAGAVLFAAGAAPGLILARVMLAARAQPERRFRDLSSYWAGIAFGAGWPLAAEILFDPSFRTILWISFALVLVAIALLGPRALDHDDDIVTEPAARIIDVPWVRRSTAAAAGVGAILIGAADPARSLLIGEWQRSPEQTAAVLAAPLAAALVILVFGPWYHRLDRLTGSRRADVVGTQLAAVGTAALIGGLSFTYIGLVVAWAIAGGCLGLALAGLDAATFASLDPALRRQVAARQVQACGLAGAGAAAFNRFVIGDWSDQWKIALPAIPLIAAGLVVRRFADSARPSEIASVDVTSAAVPRRVAEPGHDSALLSVENLHVAYGSVQVLFGVDLHVDPGEVVALLGPNGAGKTTLLRAISGLEPSIGGRLVYAGLDITRTKPTWRVGMGLTQVVGGEAVVGDLTVHENLRLFSHLAGDDRKDTGIERAYAQFPRLRERREQRAATLSGGEQQMLGLAKALIVTPRLLLIDEFSLGLAPAVVANLLPVVRAIAERGAAVLIVEQSVDVALSVADRAYVMEKGAIVLGDDSESLRGRPDLLAAAYLQGLGQAQPG